MQLKILMKNIFLAFILIIISSGKAQNLVVNLKSKGNVPFPTKDHYFKDIGNVLSPFVGTWVYTNGNTTLKINFIKKLKRLVVTLMRMFL